MSHSHCLLYSTIAKVLAFRSNSYAKDQQTVFFVLSRRSHRLLWQQKMHPSNWQKQMGLSTRMLRLSFPISFILVIGFGPRSRDCKSDRTSNWHRFAKRHLTITRFCCFLFTRANKSSFPEIFCRIEIYRTWFAWTIHIDSCWFGINFKKNAGLQTL